MCEIDYFYFFYSTSLDFGRNRSIKVKQIVVLCTLSYSKIKRCTPGPPNFQTFRRHCSEPCTYVHIYQDKGKKSNQSFRMLQF